MHFLAMSLQHRPSTRSVADSKGGGGGGHAPIGSEFFFSKSRFFPCIVRCVRLCMINVDGTDKLSSAPFSKFLHPPLYSFLHQKLKSFLIRRSSTFVDLANSID